MADIRKYGLLYHFRSDSGVHIRRFRNGRLARAGRGLAFWFMPRQTSISEIPIDDRDMVLFFKGRSRDFQALTVQGNLTWQVRDPEVLADRLDFSIDLERGGYKGAPVDQIEALLTGLAQQIATQYMAEQPVRELLDAGIEPLRKRLEQGLAGTDRLNEMGISVVAIRLAAIAPSAELERALQTPTFETLQQKADQAVFERRALAVEKERAIAENELHNKTELARREETLIAQESTNARGRADGVRAAKQIEADGEAGRIRTIEQARSDAETARIAIYRDLPVQVLLGLAAREMAGKLSKIDHVNVTPDLLAALTRELGRDGTAPLLNAPKG
jgi:regulator of protease activity HflC (stomatin/prohibitin superfamily)